MQLQGNIMSQRWHIHEVSNATNSRVDEFLKDIEQVCRKHGMSIGHEDGHGTYGAFVVSENLREDDIEWLNNAHVAT